MVACSGPAVSKARHFCGRAARSSGAHAYCARDLAPVHAAQVQAKQGASDASVAALARAELLWRDFFRFTASKHTRTQVRGAQQAAAGRSYEGAPAAPPALPQLAMA